MGNRHEAKIGPVIPSFSKEQPMPAIPAMFPNQYISWKSDTPLLTS